MGGDLPVRQPSLSDQIYEIILKEISEGKYPPGSKLPSENELAERFDVSRPTVRAAFNRLVELGYVRKRRGVGTFVANSPSIANPLYHSFDIHERIRARGFTPGFEQIGAEIIPADEWLSEKLDIPLGSKVLNVKKIFTADDAPIIYFINYIPEWVYEDHLTEEEVLEPGITEPFFIFFGQECNKEIEYLASVITPHTAKECDLPEEFDIDGPHTPLLVVEDIGYDNDDLPIVLSIEHLAKEASNFHVLRRVENI